ncbi:MAG: 5'-nucleotidase C-terminal domain-containing protein [Acetobacteraceae bacterium]|nr:5'-nucleotidase C-terminal domain-containing protein [Acetobacteraceae bacterium]
MLHRRHLPLLAPSALGLPALRPARAETAARIALLHLNDFHSRHEPIAATTAACRPAEACFGGSARIAGALRAAREEAAAEGRATLTLEAGDAFLGSLFFTHHRGLAEAAAQRGWGTQAFALGNHEFDLGPGVLAAYAAAVDFPILAANLATAAEPDLARRIRPWAEFRLGGARVAVLGLVTTDTPGISSPGPNLRFTDPAEATARAIREARRDGPATVVVLSHLGIGADRRLAAEVPGVDVIVGGHSHTLLAGPAHPTVLEGRDRPVRMVQAGAFGRWAGRLDLDLRADGAVNAHGGAIRELGADTPEDPAMREVVARLAAPLQALRRQAVGHLPAALPNLSCGAGPCELGRLVAEAMRQAAGAEIGWQNGGGLRAGLPGGVVTLEDVLTTLPFANTLARITLRGGDLLAALENGVSRLPQPSGRFPQTAGLRFAVEAARPAGQRVTSAEVEEAPGDWRPLDPARAYSIATNSFLRRGGDGYAAFAQRVLESRDDGPLIEDALIAWLRR